MYDTLSMVQVGRYVGRYVGTYTNDTSPLPTYLQHHLWYVLSGRLVSSRLSHHT